MADYAAGKAAWLAEGLPAEGRVADDQRILAVAEPPTGDDVRDLLAPGDPPTVRPGEPVRDTVERLRRPAEAAPPRLFVTTARGRLLGTVDTHRLLAMARRDELP